MKRARVTVQVPKVLIATASGCRSLHKLYRQKAWDHWNGDNIRKIGLVAGAFAFVGSGILGYQEANKDYSHDRGYDVRTGMLLGAACGAISGAFWPALPYVLPFVALYKGIVFSTRHKYYKH